MIILEANNAWNKRDRIDFNLIFSILRKGAKYMSEKEMPKHYQVMQSEHPGLMKAVSELGQTAPAEKQR